MKKNLSLLILLLIVGTVFAQSPGQKKAENLGYKALASFVGELFDANPH